MEKIWAPGLNPTYVPMTDKQTELFIGATFAELDGDKVSDELKEEIEKTFLIQILNKRIEAFNLPISFTISGKMAALALVEQAGGIVVLLIDCLNAFEGKTVGPGQLAELYPIGFYDEDTLHRYVNEYMKPRKVKWSDVYGSRY